MVPLDFVRLDQLIPEALTPVPYASSQNFTGRTIKGYQASYAYLKKAPAYALEQVAKAVAKDGYNLVIYDAYRPQQAVQNFLHWKDEPENPRLKKLYYPLYMKDDLFQKGYISDRSMHSTGYAVDLTLIRREETLKTPIERQITYQGKSFPVLDDGTLWMGGHFDWFHPLSHPSNQEVSSEALLHRTYLTAIMKNFGFRGISTEWWHFEWEESQRETSPFFDFVITQG